MDETDLHHLRRYFASKVDVARLPRWQRWLRTSLLQLGVLLWYLPKPWAWHWRLRVAFIRVGLWHTYPPLGVSQYL